MTFYLTEGELFARETIREQAERSHIFIRKLRRRGGATDAKPTPDAANIGIGTFASTHAAAEFALWAGLPLDTLITLDWQRMGIHSGPEAQAATGAFLKCYNAWAIDKNAHPAWIYGIERANTDQGLGYHSHVALHIPGIPAAPFSGELPPINHREHFRKWISEYTLRRFDHHIPRAIRANLRARECSFRHWNAVSYLLKGYDLSAIVQTARATVDGRTTYLGDFIPWRYCNPGAVALKNRLRVCHALGPARRAIGAPTGMEHLLPTRPNWSVFKVEGHGPMTDLEKGRISWTLPKAKPFVASWDDGIRDVRGLYCHELYRFATGQEASG
ncbi:hypothetical protein [Novosphingobium gossypii]|uniref:hypothetical protein n=1 Tax=Novosphingobium gossypii TaxID=1604774 RepID=UPI003D1D4940